MKKTILYIGSFALAAFVGLTAFSDAQSDDRKIEAKYQEMVTNFKAEKDAACKLAAVSTAEAQYQAEASGNPDAVTSAPAASGGGSQPAVKPTTGASNTAPITTGGTKPVDNTIEEKAPETTVTNPQTDRGGATTTNPEDQKDRGGATTTKPTDQKGRGGATIKND